jgi:hypothetical protein
MLPSDMNNVRFKVLIVLSLIFLKQTTNAQQLNWVKRIGNVGFDDSYALALDNNGNVYTAGSFSGTVDFNPGSTTNNLTVTEGINIDAFISKLDSAGNYVWAINFGGRGSDEVRAIKIDDSNNIYVTGTFKDTADFDPGPNVYTLIPTGNESVFVAKYDSAGAFIWAQNIAASFHVYASGMDIDQAGNVYITGNFTDTVDFDPGPNVYQLTTNTMYDGYILKLNSNGDFCWAKSIGQLTFDMGYDVKTDDFGAVYTVGTFRLTVDFDPGPGIYNLTSNGSDDVFILKLDTAGNFIWAKSFGGTSFDYGRGLSIDPFGNVITTGSFSSIVDFNPGLGVFNISQISIGGEDIFVSKLDSAGNFLWAKQFGGVGLGFGAYVSTNNIGDVFTTGRFDGVTDFNPGPGVLNFTQVGLSGADMYIVKLSPSGNFFWAKQIAGPLYDYAYAIEPDALGNIYYTGFFEGTVDFDPNTPVYNLISAGSHDIFVSKLGGTITSVQQQNFEDKLMVYPVPASDHIIIHTSLSPSKLEMFDVNGRLFLTVNKEELQFINYDLYLSTDTISNGIYFLKISDELHFSTQKIVVQH